MSPRARDIVGVAALALLGASAGALAFRSGGYFLADWGLVAIVILSGVALVGLLAGGLGGWVGIASVGSWIGLAAFQAVSANWAGDPGAAQDAANLTLLYAGALALAMMGLRHASWLTRVVDITLIGVAAVSAIAVATRLAPGVVGEDPHGRLSWPIGYWNGLGALVAMGAVMAIGVAGTPTRRLALRVGSAALVPMFALALLMTVSRGAVAVGLLSLLLLVIVGPARLETISVAVACIAVSIPLLLDANGQEGLVSLAGAPPEGHGAAGIRVAVLLVIAMAAAGAAAALSAIGLRRVASRVKRRIVVGLGIAAVCTIVIAVLAPPPPGGLAGAADEQFRSFQSFQADGRTESESLSDRLVDAAGTGRWQNWEVAAEQWRSAPLAGTGAGEYVLWWNERRPFDQSVRNAHSVYLEVAGESGLLGLVLLVAPLAIGAFVLVRARLRGPLPPDLAREHAIVGAAVLVIVLHSAGDWDWQLPGIVLPAVLLGGAAVKSALAPRAAPTSPGDYRPTAVWGRLAIALVALLCIPLLAGPTEAARQSADARSLARAGDLLRALDRADDAAAANPRSASARLLRANLLDDLGRQTEADAAYREALERSPWSWLVLSDWAASLQSRGERRAARILVERAESTNPLERRVILLSEATRELPK